MLRPPHSSVLPREGRAPARPRRILGQRASCALRQRRDRNRLRPGASLAVSAAKMAALHAGGSQRVATDGAASGRAARGRPATAESAQKFFMRFRIVYRLQIEYNSHRV